MQPWADSTQVKMQLAGVGYGENVLPVSRAEMKAAANRIEYTRGEVAEWYVNSPLGLEQGFTLKSAPAGGDGETPLRLRIAVEGEVRMSLAQDAESVVLRGRGGQAIRYGKLYAYD
ncbi:MAG: hypothetical protein ACRERD_07620, partial [Candidatus Binatia bacterium]